MTRCLKAPTPLPTLQAALGGEEELAPQTGGAHEVTGIAWSSNSQPSNNHLSDSQPSDNPPSDNPPSDNQPSDDQPTMNGNAFKTNYVPFLFTLALSTT